VIGVNTAVIQGAQSIAFAVASNTANYVVSELLRFGRVRHGYIGIAADTVDLHRRVALRAGLSQTASVRIRRVEPSSPAERGGLNEGDLVLAIDGAPVTGVDDVVRMLDGDTIGREVTVLVFSVRGEIDTRTVIPASRP
jgi:S1-C subfamily serine protease